jgi:hypothetical protein
LVEGEVTVNVGVLGESVSTIWPSIRSPITRGRDPTGNLSRRTSRVVRGQRGGGREGRRGGAAVFGTVGLGVTGFPLHAVGTLIEGAGGAEVAEAMAVMTGVIVMG